MKSRVYAQVESKLQKHQLFRDSDKWLLLSIWNDEGLHLTPEQKEVFLNKCSVAESITRARRDLKAKYPASEAVDEARFGKYTRYKNGSWKYTDN